MSFIVINNNDSVAVALSPYKKGDKVDIIKGSETISLTLEDDINRGHKVALFDIKKGETVFKYGFAIGSAKEDIKKGSHIHSHNLKTLLSGELSYTYNKIAPAKLLKSDLTFKGYRRENGAVAIRNEVWIVPTVFCVNKVAENLARYAKDKLNQYQNVNDVVALTHPYGCSQMGSDETTTQKLLAALCSHPHAAYVLVLGLGCENNNLAVFKKFLKENDPRIVFLNSQESEDEILEGQKILDTLLSKANKYQREECPLKDLTIGLKCGGSDGLSGITANPLIGRISDLIVGSGGTSVMTEVPEMFGAERMLMSRAKDEAVFNKCVNLINDFKHYFTSHGQVCSENPSPGNKEGGITTLEDKSLGCVQKGGQAEVSDVLKYTESVSTHGLNLLQGPGNDGVSCTALAAAHCNLVLFSTGRGTPFGTAVPTVKIATNTNLYERKSNWIDFNAGAIVDGVSFETLTDELLHKIVAIASGEMTKSELRSYKEIVIWKDGVTM